MRSFLLLAFVVLAARPVFAGEGADWTVSTGTWAGPKDLVIAATARDWRQLWAKAGGAEPTPAIDFSRFLVTGAFHDGSYILRRQPRDFMTAPLKAAPQAIAMQAPPRKDGSWDFSVSFGPGRTQYMATDISVKTSDMNVVFKNVEIRERTSMEYYDFTKNPEPLRAIDEPTNTLRITAENKKRGNTVYAQMFHPKFLVSAPGLNENVTARGTVQGKPVDGPMDINAVFPTYQLTYGLVNLSVGGEKIIPLIKGKGGSVVYAAGASVGMFIGSSDAVLRDPSDANTYKEFRAQRLKPIGASVSLTNRATYAIPGERVNLSLTHTVTGGQLEYGILDGVARQSLSYQNLNLAVGVKVYKGKRKKKPIDCPL